MITRLEVDGFKSLRNFAVDLEPFTVLVGPNDAGKSNILEALALVARLGQQRSIEALKSGRGRVSEQFARHGDDQASTIRIAAETLETLTLGVSEPETGNLLEATYNGRYRYIESVVREHDRIKFSHSREHVAPGDPWLERHPEWKPVTTATPVAYAGFDDGYVLPVLHLHASNLREPSDLLDSNELASDASNLPSVLAKLSDIERGEIRGAFAGLVPGVTDFDIVRHDDSLQIEFRTRDGNKIPARLASDGTLRVLALLTAVLVRRTMGAVVCIEEPENGIYPGRLARLIDLLRELTDPSAWCTQQTTIPPPQVILTTHSPVALDALRDHRDVIRFIDTIWRDGVRSTRARRIVEDAALADRMTEASVREIEMRLRSTGNAEER